MIENYIQALKAANLMKSKDREIQAIELWKTTATAAVFKIKLDDGDDFLVNICL